jgi:hypothetical protein
MMVLVLIAAAMTANFVPACRAIRIDPSEHSASIDSEGRA